MAKAPLKKPFRYTGPVTPLELNGETKMLFPGTSYTDLPNDHPIVSNLIEKKLLVAETGDQDAADAPAEGA